MKDPSGCARVFATRAVELSEVVVHPESQVTCLQPVIDAGDRVRAAAEVHVEILDFRRPVRRKADFHTGAAGPPHECLVLLHAEEFALELAISQTKGAIKKDIVDRKAGASA